LLQNPGLPLRKNLLFLKELEDKKFTQKAWQYRDLYRWFKRAYRRPRCESSHERVSCQ